MRTSHLTSHSNPANRNRPTARRKTAKTMELYIVRHAESENNARSEEERTDDPALTPLGYRQAEYLVNRIRHFRPSRIFVSPFLRTLETIAPYIRETGQPVDAWTDIHEQGGVMSGFGGRTKYVGQPGMKRSEIEQGFPGVRLGSEFNGKGWWKCRPWEDYESARERAVRVIERIRNEFDHTGERVVLVTHGAFIRFLMGVIMDMPGMGYEHFEQFANTSVTRFTITPTYTQLGLMNCTRHLPEAWITGTDTRPYRTGEFIEQEAEDRQRCAWTLKHPLLAAFHDDEYGFPLTRDNDLLERLVLEINQAGLSWLTVLKKRKAFRTAFDQFDVDRVSAYGESDRERLLRDEGIIRNRLKIDAAIHNARVVQEISRDYGSFKHWLDSQACDSLDEWVTVFKKTFRFMGPEIVGEFLMSTGYLPIRHDAECYLAKEGHRVG